jgi:uncharacterized phage protein (TIGR02220 family)
MENNNRKAFNFYLSYFDVYQELSDKDKLAFIDALLHRQFYGVEPTELKGMVKFAYLSQKHSIDKQIEGFENKTKTKLSRPTQGGAVGGRQGGAVQEKEKEKEKEQYVGIDWDRLREKFNIITNKKSKVVPKKAKDQILARLKDGYTKEDIITAIENCFKDQFHIDNNHKHLTLEFISRPDKLERYVNTTPIVKPKKSGFAWD